MLAVIQYSFNAVMPIILMIALGALARRKGLLEPDVLRKINRFNFHFNFSALMFMNLYGVESIRKMPVRMGLFMLAALTVLFVLGMFLSGILTGERFRRGVLVQAMFRSNYAIIGIPVSITLVGEAGGQLASFLQFPTILFNNFMSVLVLSIFCDYEAQYRLYGEGPLAESMKANAAGNLSTSTAPGDATAAKSMNASDDSAIPSSKVDIKKIAIGIVKNPLIQGLTAGMVVLLLREVLPLRPDGEIVFSLQRDLPWLYSVIQSLSRLATPLALLVLGGQLEMKEIGEYKKELVAGVLMRLVGSPLIGFVMLFAAVQLGLMSVGPVEIAVMVAIFGSPLAVASIVMSYEMGGDGHLAGQIVVWSSVLGMVSLFFLIFAFRMCGLL